MAKPNRAWRFGMFTHTGNVRQENQDNLAVLLSAPHVRVSMMLAMVADGMGGHYGGSLASALAIRLMSEWWQEGPFNQRGYHLDAEQLVSEVAGVFHQINHCLVQYGEEHNQTTGTTLSALILSKSSYYVFHVGDSRIYRYRSPARQSNEQANAGCSDMDTAPLDSTYDAVCHAAIIQLTEDQSWVAAQVKNGLMSWDEARVHPRRNLLMNCLGVDSFLQVYMQKGDYEPGDLFMLCTDGYHAMFGNAEIAAHLGNTVDKNLQSRCENLVKLAMQRGSQDNVSVLLVQPPSPAAWRRPAWLDRLGNWFIRDRHKPF